MKYVAPLRLFQDVLTHTKKEACLLGLDVGDKYVGLAVSDLSNKIASPLSVLVRKNNNIDLMATDFQSLVSDYSLVGFVVGKPFDRLRSRNIHIPQVDGFIDELSKTRKLEGVPYTYWDESFTSKSVELFLRPLKLHPIAAKTIMDKFAALEILQGYLDFVNKQPRLESSK